MTGLGRKAPGLRPASHNAWCRVRAGENLLLSHCLLQPTEQRAGLCKRHTKARGRRAGRVRSSQPAESNDLAFAVAINSAKLNLPLHGRHSCPS